MNEKVGYPAARRARAGSMTSSAGDVIGALHKPPSMAPAEKVAADMRLMRVLLLDAIAPKPSANAPGEYDVLSSSEPEGHLPAGSPLGRPEQQPALERAMSSVMLDGLPRLPASVTEMLTEVGSLPQDAAESLSIMSERAGNMDASTLLSSAQLLGELMSQANLALAQQTVRAWRANLRADAGCTEDTSTGAVVGNQTFRMAFDALLASGRAAAEIRDAISEQEIEIVLTAHSGVQAADAGHAPDTSWTRPVGAPDRGAAADDPQEAPADRGAARPARQGNRAHPRRGDRARGGNLARAGADTLREHSRRLSLRVPPVILPPPSCFFLIPTAAPGRSGRRESTGRVFPVCTRSPSPPPLAGSSRRGAPPMCVAPSRRRKARRATD